MPAASPAATAVTSVPPTPTTPECDSVRYPAIAEFIRLEADAASVQSLVARRCRPEEPVIVTMQPVPEQRCGAELVVDAERRRLRPAPAAPITAASIDQNAPTEIRWSILAAELRSGAIVRITCVPATLPD
jgi:hypothetical protein